MCHRFINFETLDYDNSEGAVQSMINDYLRVITQAEGSNAVLYSKSHSELTKETGSQHLDRERSWTVCIVFNPKRNQKVDQAIRAQS